MEPVAAAVVMLVAIWPAPEIGRVGTPLTIRPQDKPAWRGKYLANPQREWFTRIEPSPYGLKGSAFLCARGMLIRGVACSHVSSPLAAFPWVPGIASDGRRVFVRFCRAALCAVRKGLQNDAGASSQCVPTRSVGTRNPCCTQRWRRVHPRRPGAPDYAVISKERFSIVSGLAGLDVWP